MTDLTDSVTLSSIGQTIALTLTLMVFILSFRSQNKAIKEDAYQKVLDDYNDAIKMLVERPELYNFWVELQREDRRPLGAEPGSYSREDMIIRNYVVMLYGLFERIHFLYRKKWIDDDTWRQWAAFLENVAAHRVFREIHRSTEGMFDKPFQDHVSKILKDKSFARNGSERDVSFADAGGP